MKTVRHPVRRSFRVPADVENPVVDAPRARQLVLEEASLEEQGSTRTVLVNMAESPLAWLARRKRTNGLAMISPIQFQAGERLRRDFTLGHMSPRITSNWDSAIAQGRRGAAGTAPDIADATVAARQRVTHALDVVGPEFAGLLLDVCCFLKGLEEVERERRWPARSGKIILQLGLDRLARHYGYTESARGKARQPIRADRQATPQAPPVA